MKTIIDVHVLEQFECLEPEVGAQLLPLYPEFLSEEERQEFELHREGCESCQERLKLWQVTGGAVRGQQLVTRARDLLREKRYEEAIQSYNHALALQPELSTSLEGLAFFQAKTWASVTAATMQDESLMPYIEPSYEPDRYQLAAAPALSPFPLSVEYADGLVRATFSVAGRQVFFMILEAHEEFSKGVKLIGKVTRETSCSFELWNVRPGKKCRLGTLVDIFGHAELADIVEALRTFKVVPLKDCLADA